MMGHLDVRKLTYFSSVDLTKVYSYLSAAEFPKGTYGKHCLQTCNFSNSRSCDRVFGTCDLMCPVGLTGPNCQTSKK